MNKTTAKIFVFFLLILTFTGSIMLVSAETNGQEAGLDYSTFVGTSSLEAAEAITVDDQGRAYVIAQTNAISIFPGMDESNTSHVVNIAVFRLDPTASTLEYDILFNPIITTGSEDYGQDITIDSTGSAYIVGTTSKENLCTFFGTVPGYDPTYNGGSFDAFVMKIKPDGSGLDYCTFLGGGDWDEAYNIALDDDNNAYLVGSTWSDDFPVTAGAYDRTINGARDIFVAKLSADGTNLEYATYMGGTGQESARALALDSQNNAYVTGWTTSDDLPTPAPVWDDTFEGLVDSFVFKLNNDGSDLLFNSYLGGMDEDRGEDIILDDQGNLLLTGMTRSPDFPTTPGAMDTTWGGGQCSIFNCADGFVARLNPTATVLDFATYIGGDNEDLAYQLSLSQDGGAFVVGESISDNGFPTTSTGYDPTPNGEGDAFLLLLNSAGSALDYGTYLGATDVDRGLALWTDGGNTVYLAGSTLSSDFPTTPGAYDTTINGDFDVFVSKLILPDVMRSFVPILLR